MKKILVTGGAGFIGSNVCKVLLEKGYSVIAIDNFITSTNKNLKDLLANKNFSFIEHDITERFTTAQSKKLSGSIAIFHLACPTGVPNLIPMAEEMLMTCSVGTKNILELARKNKSTVIFTSSSEVYGDPKVFPQTEEYNGDVDPRGVRSSYEEGKRFSESLIMMYVRKYNVDARIVRVFNTYGVGMSRKDFRVIPIFLKQALSNAPIPVEGTGNQKRTFCYVDDLVSGLLLVWKKGKKGEAYNLGGDEEVTINKLAKIILRMTGSKSKIKYVKRPSHDHQSRKPELSKIKKLGWSQKVSLSEGLQRVLNSGY